MKKSFALLLLFISSLAFADQKVILVSDIDDTIKNSHVLDTDSTVANAFIPKNAFLGMAPLYQALYKDKVIDEIVYLSNAPKFLMYPFHKRFLRKTGFPEGRLLLSKGLSNKGHKVNALREIIQNESPKELILIGDNGEKDTEIYASIQKEFPEVKMTAYIHQAYSQLGYYNNFGKKLEEGQTGFATSLDLSADLLEQGVLNEDSYVNLVKEIAPVALSEGLKSERGRPLMFPAWLDCRDFKLIEIPVRKDLSEELVQMFNSRLSERCSREPYEN